MAVFSSAHKGCDRQSEDCSKNASKKVVHENYIFTKPVLHERSQTEEQKRGGGRGGMPAEALYVMCEKLSPS